MPHGFILTRSLFVGVIFCVGGRGASGDPFKTIECYDNRKDRWFPVAEMSSRRRHVGVVSVKGKHVNPINKKLHITFHVE